MSPIKHLLDVMAKLRDPDGGCPWDLEQSFASILPYTIEEAYEVAEAIDSRDWPALRDELGDLLFQVVFYARIAEEAGLFDFDEVAAGAVEKMVRRHPHVFGDVTVEGAAGQTRAWETHKAAERAARAARDGRLPSVLDGVADRLPASARATKLQARAARVGFDWPDITPVLDKIDEEIGEIRDELADGASAERMTDEIGDLMFVCINLARHGKVDVETALRGVNAKFERRFRRIEALLAAEDRAPDDATLEEMDRLWNRAKAEETV
jgi:ATP diphosphatase